jgi:NADH-quinone oxidoreductase subunit J
VDLSAKEWAFVAFALLGVIAAVRLVTTRNVVHGALYLVASLSSVGAVFLLLGAEFVGWTQILIYVGSIVILILFGLMLTKAPIGRETLDNQQRGLAAVVALVVLAGLVLLVRDAFSGRLIQTAAVPTARVGDSIFREFILPFEAVSVLLLAALIGAVVLARKDESEEERR